MSMSNAAAAPTPAVKTSKDKFKKAKLSLRDRVTKGRVKSFIGRFFLYLLMAEIAFIIIFPLLTKLSAALMGYEDIFDRTVTFIPKHPTLENFQLVLQESNYWTSLYHTALVSLLAAVLQTMVCSLTGYGLAKLRGKLANVVFFIVLITVLVPPQVILVPMYLKFRFMNPLGLVKLLTGKEGVMNTLWPIIILSATGYGFKNGLYILVMRQFYKGVPEEIEEAAAIDGYGTLATYFRIVLPMAVPMMITIFMFAFSWQWTDTFYSGIFFTQYQVLANSIFTMPSAMGAGSIATNYNSTMLLHTGVLLAILPLIIIYCVAQRRIIAGIERSGLVG